MENLTPGTYEYLQAVVDLLVPLDGSVELCAFIPNPQPNDPKKIKTFSGIFDHRDNLIKKALAMSESDSNPATFIGVNPTNPKIFPATNTLSWERPKIPDMLKRIRLFIDFDPIRISGNRHDNSTNSEQDAAKDRAVAVSRWLTETFDFPKPYIFASSGNGAHLLYEIDLPNDKSSDALIDGCLKAIAFRFGDDIDQFYNNIAESKSGAVEAAIGKVEVDISVGKANQLTKFYGTKTRKGPDSPERPQRFSQILEVNP